MSENKIETSRLSKTKIVATYGPACSSEEVMEKMVECGVTCFRLNTAHSTVEELQKLVDFRNRVAEKRKIYVGIMVDLKGPELRALLKNSTLGIEPGKEYTLGGKDEPADICIGVEGVIKSLEKGDTVLFMDGKIRTVVTETGKSICKLKSTVSGILKHNGRMNIPGRYIPMGLLQERDMEYLKLSIEKDVEYVALSFVQNREEIDNVHDVIGKMGGNINIIAKIETRQALTNIDEIVKSTDAIMVARGDLGVEMPVHEVAMSQKYIMQKAHSKGVPIIVATQMLESMVSSDSPTRAEISDVTNAILDNTDALMLSEETAIGQYPVDAVNVLKDTSLYVESFPDNLDEPADFTGSKVTFSVSKSTRILSDQISANHIVACTRGGNTARVVSSMRPFARILAVTPSRLVASRINLYKGVQPYLIENFRDDISVKDVMNSLASDKIIQMGERIVVISGHPDHLFAGTAQVSVLTAGELVARGYAIGKNISGKINKGKGTIYMGGCDKISMKDFDFNSYEGFILTGNPMRSIIQSIQKAGKTCIYNTIVLAEIKEGDNVFIDSDIGYVYS
ncbi:MAG: pyruvate kinase [Candidatus Thermoplasmatota archaeon]|nr:pyruvate kinase [Candidatus Thermoplasmatota archaeon]